MCAFVAFVIQQAMRMRRITFSSVACLTLPYRTTYLITGKSFGGKNTEYTTHVLIFSTNFTFMLPCIVIDFFLNNQPDALIIQIYSVIKLHVSGIFFDHHQEFSTVHSALVSFMQVSDDRFQAESGWNAVPSWLCLDSWCVWLII